MTPGAKRGKSDPRAGEAQAPSPSKKEEILEAARALASSRFTSAEIEQIRRQLLAHHGEGGKTSAEYIARVLEDAGLRVSTSKRAAPQEQYEEEFDDLLHFSTLEEAEMCLIRLDELLGKFTAKKERAAIERVREVGRLGRRRAEMIARNTKVDAKKRAQKEEIGLWFGIWLQTPQVFFDWLDVRKGSPEFRQKFPPEQEDD